VLNHDTAVHSFLRPILGDVLYENKLLKQHIVKLEQRLSLLEERMDEQDLQIDYTVGKLRQYESVMDAYENRHYEREFSENCYSLNGDANCNY